MKFKVGDRVELDPDYDNSDFPAEDYVFPMTVKDAHGEYILGGWLEDRFRLAGRAAKFKGGDRVLATEEPPKGLTGTVRGFEDECFAVEFDGFTNGHSCGGLFESSGWRMESHQLELVVAAKFPVLLVDPDDEVFDTQESAEEKAKEFARDFPGDKWSVVKQV